MDGSIGNKKAHLGTVIVAIACPRFWPQISAQNTLRPLPCTGIFRSILLNSSAAGWQRLPRAQNEDMSKKSAKVEERVKRGHNCALVSRRHTTRIFAGASAEVYFRAVEDPRNNGLCLNCGFCIFFPMQTALPAAQCGHALRRCRAPLGRGFAQVPWARPCADLRHTPCPPKPAAMA